MDITKLITIAGKPGLYEVIGQSKNGLIVEGIQDKKRIPVLNTHKVSALVDISIYSYTEEVPLMQIFQSMRDFTGTTPAAKDSTDALKAYFTDILPDYDQERVYVSDIKKVVKWFSEMQAAGADLTTLDEIVAKMIGEDETEENTDSEEATEA